MELLDEEDILECGIDLYAQPPGKKLQNVLLLSGGEKALTVFSLLVAIFLFSDSVVLRHDLCRLEIQG